MARVSMACSRIGRPAAWRSCCNSNVVAETAPGTAGIWFVAEHERDSSGDNVGRGGHRDVDDPATGASSAGGSRGSRTADHRRCHIRRGHRGRGVLVERRESTRTVSPDASSGDAFGAYRPARTAVRVWSSTRNRERRLSPMCREAHVGERRVWHERDARGAAEGRCCRRMMVSNRTPRSVEQLGRISSWCRATSQRISLRNGRRLTVVPWR